jgi:hypothetical protein
MVGLDVAPMVVAGAMAAGTMAGSGAGACAITADAGTTACAAMVEPPATEPPAMADPVLPVPVMASEFIMPGPCAWPVMAACIAGCVISELSGGEDLQAEKVNGMVARTTNTSFMADLLGGWVSCWLVGWERVL